MISKSAILANSAFLIIDMLNHFSENGDEEYQRRFVAAAERTRKVEDECLHLDVPIIYACSRYSSVEEYRQAGIAKKYPPHAIAGTWGAEVYPILLPQASAYMIYKKAHSGFFETELHSLLTRLKKTNLILAGVHTHVCVLLTAADANYRGYDVVLLEDCATASTLDRHSFGVGYIDRHFGTVLNSDYMLA